MQDVIAELDGILGKDSTTDAAVWDPTSATVLLAVAFLVATLMFHWWAVGRLRTQPCPRCGDPFHPSDFTVALPLVFHRRCVGCGVSFASLSEALSDAA